MDLVHGARKEGWELEISTDDAALLSSVYRARYPSEEGLLPHGEPLADDAARALKAAKSVFDCALARLRYVL